MFFCIHLFTWNVYIAVRLYQVNGSTGILGRSSICACLACSLGACNFCRCGRYQMGRACPLIFQCLEISKRYRRGCGDVVCVTEPVYWKLKDDPSNAKVLVSLFSFVSGANHLITFIAFILNITFLKQMFWGTNKNGPNLLRSFDWGVSAPLMIVVNLFLYRIQPTCSLYLAMHYSRQLSYLWDTYSTRC